MYSDINTNKDVLKERYLFGADLVGDCGFPQLPKVIGSVDDLRPVCFKEATKEKKPRECLCHFFIDDEYFERLWNNPEQYIDMLSCFKVVCAPDFTFFGTMPKALAQYQVYRNRVLSWYLYQRGVSIVPSVGWSDPTTWEWCFDGLPQESIVAVSTNGCHSKVGKEQYRMGFHAMCEAIHPYKVICVGSPIEIYDDDVEIIYKDSYSQQMAKRLKERGKS